MKENKSTTNEFNKIKEGVYFIPEEILDSLVAKQDRILELLEAKKDAAINGFITEKKASQLINKKATWFWQMRKIPTTCLFGTFQVRAGRAYMALFCKSIPSS
jgi:hypothetical protein